MLDIYTLSRVAMLFQDQRLVQSRREQEGHLHATQAATAIDAENEALNWGEISCILSPLDSFRNELGGTNYRMH